MMANGDAASEGDLISLEAARARERAYCPYSSFAVGAAILSEDGKVFLGCNMENISFGLTICAERVAIGTAVQAGARRFSAIGIVSDSTEPAMPCGACRQVLAEFSPTMIVISATLGGATAREVLRTLLPMPRQGILG